MTTTITQNGWSNQKKQLQHDQRAMHQSVRVRLADLGFFI